MKDLFILTIALPVMSFFIACGGGEQTAEKPAEQETKPAETAAAGGAYEAMTVSNGGTIAGKVTFAGAIPAKQKLQITKDVNVCGKEPHYKEDLVVSGDKSLANVVVSIADISKGKSIDTMGDSFVMDQNGCVFKPHVTMLPAGVPCTILNSDGILHNIHTYSEKNPPINVAQPGFKKRMSQTFDEPEIIRVACDVHNWMCAYIVVTGHPYYAKTDANGKFELSNVPAGTYTVEYWHETLGKQTAEVTVPAGSSVEANIEFAVGS